MKTHRLIKLVSAAVIASAIVMALVSCHPTDSIVKLVSAQSSKCLQPINGSVDKGVAIVQATCDGSVAQQWTVTSVSSTKVHLVNRSSQLCLDARGGATDGTPIQQWPCNTITNENWSFGISNNLLSSGVSNTFSHCIATPGNQDGLSMELRFCSSAASQIWNRPPG